MHSTARTRSKLSLSRKKFKDDSHNRAQPSFQQLLSTNPPPTTELQTTSKNISSATQTAGPKKGSRFSLVLKKIALSNMEERNILPSTLDKNEQSTMTKAFSSKEAMTLELKSSELWENFSCDGDVTVHVTAATHSTELTAEDESSDFKEPLPKLMNRKRKREDTIMQHNYIKTLEEEELQLAMALSASTGQTCIKTDWELEQLLTDTGTNPDGKQLSKRSRSAKAKDLVPPLLSVTSEQARDMLAQRAQEIMKGSAVDNDEIQCTPAFRTSELAGNFLLPKQTVRHQCVVDSIQRLSNESLDALSPVSKCAPSERTKLSINLPSDLKEPEFFSSVNTPFVSEFQHFNYPTMWELTTCEKKGNKDYYVPALCSVISPVRPKMNDSQFTLVEVAELVPPTVTTSDTIAVSRELLSTAAHKKVTRLCADFGIFLGSSLFSDVEISTKGGRVIPAHAVILAARCSSLKEVFVTATSHPIRLDLAHYEESVVMAFLEFAYTGTLSELKNHVKKEAITSLAKALAFEELLYTLDVLNDDDEAHFQSCSYTRQSDEENETTAVDKMPMPSLGPIITRVDTMDSPSSDWVTKLETEVVAMNNESTRIETHSHSNVSVCSNNSNEELDKKINGTLVLDIASLRAQQEKVLTFNPKHVGTPSREITSQSCSSDELFGQSPRCIDDMNKHINMSPQQHITKDDISFAESEQEPPHKLDARDQQSNIESQSIHKDWDALIIDEVVDRGVSMSQLFSNSLVACKNHSQESESSLTLGFTSTLTPTTLTIPRERIRPHSGINNQQQICTNMFTTPLGMGQYHLETDNDLTPMPNYHSMITPMLKEKCAQFGVKPLAKRKMIAKLEEIYEYTHPLVDSDGEVLNQACEPLSNIESKNKRSKKSTTHHWNEEECREELRSQVQAGILANKKLYEDILLYKPLELSLVHTTLKKSGVTVPKEKLRDILDQLCVTFTILRHTDVQKTEVSR